jgi:hypothetical protein
MAFVIDQAQEEQDKQAQAGQDGQPQGPVLGAPGAAPIQGSAGGQSAAESQKAGGAKPSSSGFVNMQKYVDANKGVGTQMAQKTTDLVQGKASDADATAGGWSKTAKDQVKAGGVTQDEGVFSNLQRIASGQAASLDADALKKQLGATYQGPKAAQDVDQAGLTTAMQKHAAVQDFGELAGQGYQGTQALADETYGKNGKGYRAGERNFDAFLMNTDGQDTVKSINDQYGKYEDKVKSYTDDVSRTISDTAAQTDAVRARSNALKDMAISSVKDRFAKAQAEAQANTAANQRRFQDLQQGQNTGLSDAERQALTEMGGNFSALVNRPTQMKYSAGDFVADADAANFRNLMQAIGLSSEVDRYADAYKKSGAQEVGVNTGAKDAILRSQQMLRDADARANAENARRAAEYSQKVGGVRSLLGAEKTQANLDAFADTAMREFGLSREDAELAFFEGIDPTQFYSGPTNANAMSQLDVNEFTRLVNMIGADAARFGAADAGRGVGLNTQGLRDTLANRRAELGEDHSSWLQKKLGAGNERINRSLEKGITTIEDRAQDVGGQISSGFKKSRRLSDERAKTDKKKLSSGDIDSFLKSLSRKKGAC